MTEKFVAPEFIDNSDPDIVQSRMMNNLPVDISDMPADFPYDFTMPTAIEISRLIQYNLVRTLMLMFPMWAWGEWLDLHGVSAKVTRKQASRASGHVTVTGTPGTVIEEGTVFCTEGTADTESIEFATTVEETISDSGTVDIAVASVMAGAAYNVTRNTVILQKQANKNITAVTNENPIRGGTDEEDDDTYRERILEKLRSAEVSFVGCDADYVRWAKEVSGVGSAVVEAEWKGPGTVKVVVADPDGSAVGEDTLKAVEDYIVSPKDRMKRLAPIGASVTISTVKDMTISYSAVLVFFCIFYMDDILLIGAREADVKRAARALEKYLLKEYGLTIKPDADLFPIDYRIKTGYKYENYREKDKAERRGKPIDMMGYVIYRDHTEIRSKIFLRARRAYSVAWYCMKNGVEIPLEIAYKCTSYYGWFKHTDSKYVKDKYNIDAVCAAAKRRISKHAKSEIYGTSARSALAAC